MQDLCSHQDKERCAPIKIGNRLSTSASCALLQPHNSGLALGLASSSGDCAIFHRPKARKKIWPNLLGAGGSRGVRGWCGIPPPPSGAELLKGALRWGWGQMLSGASWVLCLNHSEIWSVWTGVHLSRLSLLLAHTQNLLVHGRTKPAPVRQQRTVTPLPINVPTVHNPRATPVLGQTRQPSVSPPLHVPNTPTLTTHHPSASHTVRRFAFPRCRLFASTTCRWCLQ